jgi:hypothetical protein
LTGTNATSSTSCCWKITEAEGKYKTRYVSAGAQDAPKGTKLQHEHVIPRKEIIDGIMQEPARARELLASAIGCTVTKEEHERLTAITRSRNDLRGWERYTAVGITVIDTKE